MSVLERTRDSGVMKTVGARDRQVLGLLLSEGALLGLLGGAGGVLGTRLASWPAEGTSLAVLEKQMERKAAGPVFLFPPWLKLGAPVFTTLLTAAATFLPARRAACVDPVTALRHD